VDDLDEEDNTGGGSHTRADNQGCRMLEGQHVGSGGFQGQHRCGLGDYAQKCEADEVYKGGLRMDGEKEENKGDVQKEVIPKDVLIEMVAEGMTEAQVMKLLLEMEMFEEDGEDMWGEDLEKDQDDEQMAEMDLRERLPMEIMPSVQDIAEEIHTEVGGGFFIP
jgi:hypothetical protein